MVHSVVDKVALEHFGLRAIATVKECASDFYAITIERRAKHPVVAAITEHGDLIIVGTHRRQGVALAWYGSVSRGILHQSAVSVGCAPG